MISFKRKEHTTFIALVIIILIIYALKRLSFQWAVGNDHFGWLQGLTPPAEGCTFQNFHHLMTAVEDKYVCTSLARKMFELEVKNGSLVVPPTFEARVRAWVKNDDDLYQKVLNSKVLQVFNPWTMTTTVYNPLRASRPLPQTKIDPERFAFSYFNSSRDSCDFCHYERDTANDPFGRFDTPLAATAANVFKINGYHSLVFPKKHNALNLSQEEFIDVFFLAQNWFHKVYQISGGKYSHPHLIFDILSHSGASQAHPHLHLFPGKS